MIFNFLASFIFFSLYSLWLALSLVLAVLGFFLPIKAEKLHSNEVKASDTICKSLFEKNKLSAEDYAFESEKVAENYNHLVFKGYGFIVAPVIGTLKKSNAIDRPILFLVHRWMRVHHHILKTENKNKIHKSPSSFDLAFTQLCVSIAKGTGKSLSLFV